MGDNAAVAGDTGADIAVHPDDAYRLLKPEPLCAPFDLVLSVAAVELAEEDEVRFGEDRLRVLPGHGAATTIGHERTWMELVCDQGQLLS